ncbi:hypothetical protein [Winogradskyella sp.]|jgi:hypothetical protein|uniref:hypothetical protein n=1 Tax=Winogradskyella sp. TaxID=1883156 RepID=UPI0025E8DAEB|nr:hypothetical protein [Winogradskyella sp.]MCT4630764.1 hypothetical protein [Winogradskyella sp.]
MIVNPQLFNYRLIISSLLVVLTVLGIYSFTNYKSIKSYEEFLKQEKVLIEKELSEMLTSYDELSQDYDLMASKLQEAKLETKIALDSLRLLKSDLSIITKFKDQLLILKTKSKVLLATVDSLNSANLKLQEEKRYAMNTIKNNALTIDALEETNSKLHKTIDNAALLKANSVKAEALRINNSKRKSTQRAKRVNAMDVCVFLNENPLTEKGDKEVYIQIVSPDNNIVADKGEVFFNNTSLIYSKKEIINFNNKDLNICTTVATYKDDRPLKKGTYFINVFHKNRKLGSTSVLLK